VESIYIALCTHEMFLNQWSALALYYTYITNYLIPRNRLLLQKLTVTQLVKKFPEFYGTRRFITVLTTAHHWSLS